MTGKISASRWSRAGLSNVVAIAAGGWHSLALKSDGTLVGWGDNQYAELNTPAGLSNIVAIAGGGIYSMALRSDGTVIAWGDDSDGETNLPAGLTNAVAIAAGGWHGLALKRNGTVVAWGAGTGTNTYLNYKQNIVPAGLTNVIQIAGGLLNSLVLVGSGPPVLTAPLNVNSLGTNGFYMASSTFNGRVYQLEYVNSLTNQIWTPLPLQYGTGGIVELNDPTAAAATQRFYRLNRW